MIELLLLAAAVQAKPGYEPPPEVFYPQAVACGVSAKIAKGNKVSGAEFAELMIWGFILAENGRKLGRTKEQVDSGDLKAAEPFYLRLRDKKPKAFAAHRSYCKALLDAERP